MEIADPDTARLVAIVDASDDAIVTHSMDGVIATWNPAAERMFGYAADDAVGRSVELLVAPEHRVAERRLIGELRHGRILRHIETVAVTKTGARLDVSVTLSPLVTPDGEVIGAARIARDVSRERFAERELARLAAIVDSAEDAIISKDLNGTVLTWNRAAEQMFGYQADEIVGRSISQIIPLDRLAEEDDVLRRIREGRSVEHFETVRQRKDGSFVEISLTVSPIRAADGRVIGASKIARDISAQRRLVRAAEEASRVKDEFLAMLSHELRTPLNSVLGYTRLLRTGHFSPERRDRAIDTIERNARVLSQLVSDVLDVSSIVTGKMTLKRARCDLRRVAESAVDIVRPSAEARNVAMMLQKPDAPMWAMCDADRLQQILWNLLVNAVKFTPPDGRIDVRVELESRRRARIVVSDTGVGIRPESLPYIFQRFWQGERTSQGAHGGLGLGLALARHFTELHGGTITATSAGEGHGATFSVTLPLLPEDADATGSRPASENAAAS